MRNLGFLFVSSVVSIFACSSGGSSTSSSGIAGSTVTLLDGTWDFTGLGFRSSAPISATVANGKISGQGPGRDGSKDGCTYSSKILLDLQFTDAALNGGISEEFTYLGCTKSGQTETVAIRTIKGTKKSGASGTLDGTWELTVEGDTLSRWLPTNIYSFVIDGTNLEGSRANASTSDRPYKISLLNGKMTGEGAGSADFIAERR